MEVLELTMMMKRRCAGLVGMLLLAGCHAPLSPRISCEQVGRLRLGQSRAEVRAILGVPQATHIGPAVPWYGGPLPYLEGETWEYGGGAALALTRAEFHVSFHDDKLTWASAYLKRAYQEGGDPAFFLLGDPREPDKPPTRREGSSFATVFPCRAKTP